MNPWFITGICEGEGTFTFSRAGKLAILYFAIKLAGKEEKLMRKIHEFFGAGKLYQTRPNSSNARSGRDKIVFYYRVSKLADLRRIIEHFDAYPLQGEKSKSYAAWKELVLLKEKNLNKKRWHLDDLNKFHELLAKLSNNSSRRIA